MLASKSFALLSCNQEAANPVNKDGSDQYHHKLHVAEKNQVDDQKPEDDPIEWGGHCLAKIFNLSIDVNLIVGKNINNFN